MALDLTIQTSAVNAEQTKNKLDGVVRATREAAQQTDRYADAQKTAANIVKQGYSSQEAMAMALMKVSGAGREAVKSLQGLFNAQKIYRAETEAASDEILSYTASLEKSVASSKNVVTTTNKAIASFENEVLVLGEVNRLMQQGLSKTEATKVAKMSLAGASQQLISEYLKESKAQSTLIAQIKQQDVELKKLIVTEQNQVRAIQDQLQWVRQQELASLAVRKGFRGTITDLQEQIKALAGGAQAWRNYEISLLRAKGATQDEATQIINLRTNLETLKRSQDKQVQAAVATQAVTTANSRAFKQNSLDVKNLGKNVDFLTRAYQNLTNVGIGVTRFAIGLFAFQKIQTSLTTMINDFQQIDKVVNALQTVEGSLTSAGVKFEELSKRANELRLDSLELSAGFANFKLAGQSLGLTSDQIATSFDNITTAAAGANVSQQDFQGVMRAVTQIMSKGKVQAEELRGQLGDRLPGAFAIAAEAMGVTTAELDKMLKDGKLLSKEFIIPFGEAMRETFGPAAERRVNTISGAFTNLRNSNIEVNKAFKEAFGPALVNSLNATASAVNFLADNFELLTDSIGTLLVAYLSFTRGPAAVALLATTFSKLGVVVASVASQMVALAAGSTTAAAALKALGVSATFLTKGNVIGIALSALATAGYLIYDAMSDASAETDRLTQEMKDLAMQSEDARGIASRYAQGLVDIANVDLNGLIQDREKIIEADSNAIALLVEQQQGLEKLQAEEKKLSGQRRRARAVESAALKEVRQKILEQNSAIEQTNGLLKIYEDAFNNIMGLISQAESAEGITSKSKIDLLNEEVEALRKGKSVYEDLLITREALEIVAKENNVSTQQANELFAAQVSQVKDLLKAKDGLLATGKKKSKIDKEAEKDLKRQIALEENLRSSTGDLTSAQFIYNEVLSGATAQQAQFNNEVRKLQEIINNSNLPELERQTASAKLEALQLGEATNKLTEEQEKLKDKAKEAAEELKKSYERAAERIEDIFTRLFRSALDGFDSFAEALKDEFKNLLVELAIQASKNAIIIPIVQSVGGAFGINQGTLGGITQALGGSGGIGSGFAQQALEVLSDKIGDLGFKFGSEAVENFGNALLNPGFLKSIGTAFAIGGVASSFIRSDSQMDAGVFGGIAGAASLANPIAGAIIAAIGAVDKIAGGGLFGTKFRTVGQKLIVDIQDGILDATVESLQKRKKSLFRGNKYRTIIDEATGLDEVLQAGFEGTILAIKSAQGLFGEVLTPDSFRVSEDFKNKSEEEIQAILEGIIGRAVASATVATSLSRAGIGFDTSAASNQLIGAMGGLSSASVFLQAERRRKEEELRNIKGTGRAGMLQRSAIVKEIAEIDRKLSEVSSTFAELNKQLSEVNVNASEAIVSVFGSLDNFFQALSFFEQNFLDETQLFARQTVGVINELNDLFGLSLSSLPSREEFTGLVQGINAATDPELLRNALALAPAFDAILDSLDQTAEAAKEFDLALGFRNEIQDLNSVLRDVGLNLTDLQERAESEEGLVVLKDILEGLSDSSKQQLLPVLDILIGQIPQLGSVLEDAGGAIRDFTDFNRSLSDQIAVLTSSDTEITRLEQRFRDLREEAAGADQSTFDLINSLEELEFSALEAERAAAALEQLNDALRAIGDVRLGVQRSSANLAGGVTGFDLNNVLNNLASASNIDAFVALIPALDSALSAVLEDGIASITNAADTQKRLLQDNLADQLDGIRSYYDALADEARRSAEELLDIQISGIEAQRDAALRALEDEQRLQQRAFDRQQELERQAFDASRQALVDNVNAQLEAQLESLGLQEDAINDLIRSAEQLQNIARGFREFVDQLNRSDFGPGDAVARTQVALSQFRNLAGLAEGGDVNAAGQLQGVASDLLDLARQSFASGSGFSTIFSEVTGTLTDLADLLDVASPEQQQIQALQDQAQALRDAAEAQIEAINAQTEELALQFRYAQEDAAFLFGRDLGDTRDALQQTFSDQIELLRQQNADNLAAQLAALQAQSDAEIAAAQLNFDNLIASIDAQSAAGIQALKDSVQQTYSGILDGINILEAARSQSEAEQLAALEQVRADIVGAVLSGTGNIEAITGVVASNIEGTTGAVVQNTNNASIIGQSQENLATILSNEQVSNLLSILQTNQNTLAAIFGVDNSVIDGSNQQYQTLLSLTSEVVSLNQQLVQLNQAQFDQGRSPATWLNFIAGLLNNGDGVVGGTIVSINQAVRQGLLSNGVGVAEWTRFTASLLNNGDGVVGGNIVLATERLDQTNKILSYIALLNQQAGDRLTSQELARLNQFRQNFEGYRAEPVPSALGNIFSAGTVKAFAEGGMFTNTIASGPTLAPMALFGEAGPEAIMPLSRGSDGSLGVRITESTIDLTPVVMQLTESNEHQAAAVRVLQAGFSRLLDKVESMEDALESMERSERLKKSA